PTDASTPAGSFSVNVVRYQATPGSGSLCGSDTGVQLLSGYPGRYQPARSPNRPPLFIGPRTVSVRFSPPSLPWIFQEIAAAEPVNVTAVRPRAALLALLELPSSLCPIIRTITESLCVPLVCRADGIGNVAVAASTGLVEYTAGVGSWLEPTNVPSSQASIMPT